MTPTSPGTYFYTDAMPDAKAERVQVVDDAGVLCARFEDEDGIELIPIGEMAGTFAPA
jgi:hypothetical protein